MYTNQVYHPPFLDTPTGQLTVRIVIIGGVVVLIYLSPLGRLFRHAGTGLDKAVDGIEWAGKQGVNAAEWVAKKAIPGAAKFTGKTISKTERAAKKVGKGVKSGIRKLRKLF